MRTLLTYKKLKLNNNKSLKNIKLQSMFVYIFLLHNFIICRVYQHEHNTIICGESVPLRYPYVFGSIFFKKKFQLLKTPTDDCKLFELDCI